MSKLASNSFEKGSSGQQEIYDHDSSLANLMVREHTEPLHPNQFKVGLKRIPEMKYSEEYSESRTPGNMSKDISTTQKEHEIISAMKNRIFEVPIVNIDDPKELALNTKIRNTLQIGQDSGQIRQRRISTVSAVNIFKQLLEQEEDETSFTYKVMNNSVTQLFILSLTIYTLFSEDYQVLTSDKQLDIYYDLCTIACMFVFFMELLIFCFVKDDYLNSYSFWFDTLSLITLLQNVDMVTNLYTIARGNSYLAGVQILGNISRLVRFVRLLNGIDFFKGTHRKKTEDEVPNPANNRYSDSKIGRVMSTLATKTVIITCFIMLTTLPFYSAELYLEDMISVDAVCQQYKQLLQFPTMANFVTSRQTFDGNLVSNTIDPASPHLYVNNLTAQVLQNFIVNEYPIVSISLGSMSPTYFFDPVVEARRSQEMYSATCSFVPAGQSGDQTIKIVQDRYSNKRLGAYLSIAKVFFVCFVVLGGSQLFERGIKTLMIAPIERMIDRVTNLIEKPLKIKEEAFIQEEQKQMAAYNKGALDTEPDRDGSDDEAVSDKGLETEKIEAAINKIGILLGVGFGDAGAGLIKSYLSKDGEGDIIMPGAEIEAIFGFCDIRNFTDVTEILQEEVMVFVNTIAEIVHTLSDKYIGSANKNIGDAFLLVWKPPQELVKTIRWTKTNQLNTMNCLADLALITFLKIYYQINSSFKFMKYVNNQEIRDRVGQDYKIRMGFGLHYGWAIEGAIGSYFKVDVSYLSPNVNMAARLEAASKQYGVPILLSGEFHDLLSLSLKQSCRKLDVVYVKGSEEPLRLYAPDISDKAINYAATPGLSKATGITQEAHNFKKLIISQMQSSKNVGPPIFVNDPEISALFCLSDTQARNWGNTAVEAYERGEWKMAKNYFEKILAVNPTDGPTNNIYSFMKGYSFIPPRTWNGVRYLTEK